MPLEVLAKLSGISLHLNPFVTCKKKRLRKNFKICYEYLYYVDMCSPVGVLGWSAYVVCTGILFKWRYVLNSSCKSSIVPVACSDKLKKVRTRGNKLLRHFQGFMKSKKLEKIRSLISLPGRNKQREFFSKNYRFL